ncbi:PspC domain-containing protein [Herpetosiphon sp. NSE202]|uniref:PspC domain-containing protein n=1 Tax=Herpetosiphon sp. NSE202 TaxID=3351349 RepID=UPI0036442BD8
MTTQVSNRLTRSATDRRFAGVCGGIAEYLAVDSIWVRLSFVLLVWTGISILLYPLLWFIMPRGAVSYLAQPGQVVQQPVNYQVAQSVGVQPSVNARFDPMTGQAIKAEPYRFDPVTGQPVGQSIPVSNLSTPVATVSPDVIKARRNLWLKSALVIGGALFLSSILVDIAPVLIPVGLVVAGVWLIRNNKI